MHFFRPVQKLKHVEFLSLKCAEEILVSSEALPSFGLRPCNLCVVDVVVTHPDVVGSLACRARELFCLRPRPLLLLPNLAQIACMQLWQSNFLDIRGSNAMKM